MSQKLSRYTEFTTDELKEIHRGLAWSSNESQDIDGELNDKLSNEIKTLLKEKGVIVY